jgi:hypothetical protein
VAVPTNLVPTPSDLTTNMPFLVKLSRYDVTRLVKFDHRPTWSDMAAKIQQLFAIPVEVAGVSYKDADGDEVTLSTQSVLVSV